MDWYLLIFISALCVTLVTLILSYLDFGFTNDSTYEELLFHRNLALERCRTPSGPSSMPLPESMIMHNFVPSNDAPYPQPFLGFEGVLPNWPNIHEDHGFTNNRPPYPINDETFNIMPQPVNTTSASNFSTNDTHDVYASTIDARADSETGEARDVTPSRSIGSPPSYAEAIIDNASTRRRQFQNSAY